MIITGLALGIVLGFVLQRGRFCVTGAFRDVWLTGRSRLFTAFLIVIAVQAVGVALLEAFGVLSLPHKPLGWLAVAVGSLVFGVGIVLAGGCATGTWYRSGEGLVGSWIALVGYGVSAAAMKDGALAPLNEALRAPKVPLTTIPESLGISPWFLIALLVAGVGTLVARELRRPRRVVAALPAERTGLAHWLLEKPWHPFVTALIIAAIAIAAYPLSFAAGRKAGLGITTPSANLTGYIVTGDPSKIDWGVLLVLGILVGSFIAAKASGEFRVRVPDATTILRSIVGGVAMGVGAAWAGGCTIGNSMVETSQLAYQGWLAFGFTFLGVGLATRFFLPNPTRARADLTRPVPVAA